MNTRQSNAELLRIIGIILILLHHFCMHGLYPELLFQNVKGYGWDSHFLLFIHAFLYIGVNCFVMISGWYGIKPKLRSFLNLYLIYGFYNLLCPIKGIVSALVHGNGFVMPCSVVTIIERTIFPFAHGDLWFMNCYIALFFMAPLLNVAIEHLDKKKFLYVLGALTILNVYFAYYWKIYMINSAGFSVEQFIYLYLIGAYLHRHVQEESLNLNRWKNFWGYISCGVLWGVCTMLMIYQHSWFKYAHWETLAYNNPILLLTAIFFFLFMMSWRFQNRFVNWLAASTLGVYMLNEMVIRYSFIKPFAHAYTPIMQIGFWFGISITFYVAAIFIDKIRVLFTRPIWCVYDRWIDSYLKKTEKY